MVVDGSTSDGPGRGSVGAGSTPATDGPEPDPSLGSSNCSTGFHVCSSSCVENRSPENCGTSCEACPAIGGGVATCDGFRCGVACPSGQKPCLDRCVPEGDVCDGACPDGKNSCGGVCVEATSLSACGSSCSPCPASPDGVSSCDGDRCTLTCNPRFHRCGDACLSDNNVTTCGNSCAPCPVPAGGRATCDGTKCGAECPEGSILCAGACIPSNQACNGVCPSGQRQCSGMCVPTDDVNFCGSSCLPCPTKDNSDAKCQGGTCTYSCRAGYHKCGDLCRDDRSVETCGSRCERCPSPTNSTPSCNGSSCSFTCNPGTHQCGDACVARTQSCKGACPAGLRVCGAACVDGNCCNDGDCGACKTCQSSRCVSTGNGQPGPSCSGGTCAGDNLTRRVCQQGECRESNTSCSGFGCDGSSACRTSCGPNTFRRGNACVSCGGNSGRCCPGDTRDCSNNCGDRGTARCNNEGAFDMSGCPANRSPGQTDRSACGSTCARCGGNDECRGGRCQPPCGANGDQCCPGNTCNGSNLFCDGRSCVQKLGRGRPCGSNNNCQSGKCGAVTGEGVCCDSCRDGDVCSSDGTCRGGPGKSCNPQGSNTCLSGFCEPAGTGTCQDVNGNRITCNPNTSQEEECIVPFHECPVTQGRCSEPF